MIARLLPELAPHTRAVPSAPAVATSVLSGLNTAWTTAPVCPESTVTGLPERTIGWMVDIGLYHGAVDAQLAPTADLELRRQLDDPVIDLLQRVWPNQFGPADQRGIVGHSL